MGSIMDDREINEIAMRLGREFANQCGCGAPECRINWENDVVLVIRGLHKAGYSIHRPAEKEPS
jgi:hypothetical protein